MDSAPETTRPPASVLVGGATPALEDRYELGELLGVGGSAWVYRAEDRLLRREVAVKLYPVEVGEPDRVRQQRELSLLAQLNHPNLVKLLDAGEDSGRAFLVMELVTGRTLSERVAEGPLPPAEVARLGAAVGDALAYVHERGITHRDVKPANVLLGDRPMLSDFGIARLVDTARITQTGYLIGTPAYLAPEQVSGGDVDGSADVYALGLMLLEALTGRREFTGDGPEAAFARLNRRPAVPAGLPGLSDLLHAMTATDPGVRPTAADAAAALRRAAPVLEHAPTVTTHVGARPAAGPRDRTSVLPVAGAAPGPAWTGPGGATAAGARPAPGRKVLAAVLAVLFLGGGALAYAAGWLPEPETPVPPQDATVTPVAPTPRPTTPTESSKSSDSDKSEERSKSRSNKSDENGSAEEDRSRNSDSSNSGSSNSGSSNSGSSNSGSSNTGSSNTGSSNSGSDSRNSDSRNSDSSGSGSSGSGSGNRDSSSSGGGLLPGRWPPARA